MTETTESRAVLNICEYVFNVSSIFVCPKYLATNVTLAPLLISNDAHECLKSWILITFKPARLASLYIRIRYRFSIRYSKEIIIKSMEIFFISRFHCLNCIILKSFNLCQLCLKDNVYTHDNLQVHHSPPTFTQTYIFREFFGKQKSIRTKTNTRFFLDLMDLH